MDLAAGSAPGSLTVPLLHGWPGVLAVVVTAVVVGAGFLLVGALVTGRRSSPDWQEWLDARSRSPHDPREPAAPVRPRAERVEHPPGHLRA